MDKKYKDFFNKSPNPTSKILSFFNEEIKDVILRHVKYLRELKGDHLAMLEMRGQIAYYLKGLPNSTNAKKELFQTKTIDDTLKLIEEYFSYLFNVE